MTATLSLAEPEITGPRRAVGDPDASGHTQAGLIEVSPLWGLLQIFGEIAAAATVRETTNGSTPNTDPNDEGLVVDSLDSHLMHGQVNRSG
jgi:hypothetical protein